MGPAVVAKAVVSALALVDAEGRYEEYDLPGLAADVGSRMRLYLLDMPERSATRILAIAVVAPEESFETLVGEAAPIVAYFELRQDGS